MCNLLNVCFVWCLNSFKNLCMKWRVKFVCIIIVRLFFFNSIGERGIFWGEDFVLNKGLIIVWYVFFVVFLVDWFKYFEKEVVKFWYLLGIFCFVLVDIFWMSFLRLLLFVWIIVIYLLFFFFWMLLIFWGKSCFVFWVFFRYGLKSCSFFLFKFCLVCCFWLRKLILLLIVCFFIVGLFVCWDCFEIIKVNWCWCVEMLCCVFNFFFKFFILEGFRFLLILMIVWLKLIFGIFLESFLKKFFIINW